MEAAERVSVEVVYALPKQQLLVSVWVPLGSTVAAAVRASGILARIPQIDPVGLKVGIFGRRVSPEHVLRPGDRIEIYRELIADPKTARRVRAAGSR
jgi:putative ubiquitin-RnfH superfamily antitoxin RatB of RatAB toxin-antitoxin module